MAKKTATVADEQPQDIAPEITPEIITEVKAEPVIMEISHTVQAVPESVAQTLPPGVVLIQVYETQNDADGNPIEVPVPGAAFTMPSLKSFKRQYGKRPNYKQVLTINTENNTQYAEVIRQANDLFTQRTGRCGHCGK